MSCLKVVKNKGKSPFNSVTGNYFTVSPISKATCAALKDVDNDNRFSVLSAIDFFFSFSLNKAF